MQFLGVLVKVEVDAAVLPSRLVDENVVEIVPKPLHSNDSKRRNLVVDDVLPGNLSFNDVCADDVNDVVADVEQLDEVLKFLLNQVLGLLVQLLCDVRDEVQLYELSSGGHREEVRRDFVYAPVAFGEFRNGPVLPKSLVLVCD